MQKFGYPSETAFNSAVNSAIQSLEKSG